MKKRIISAFLLVFVAIVALIPSISFKAEAAETETLSYTFSSYTAGTQYAVDEEHVLDDNTTVTTTQAHFTTQLRLYSSSEHDGYAIIHSKKPVTAIAVNAGNRQDTLNVYVCNDGSSWNLAGTITTTSTSYNDYTLDLNGEYNYIKLDVAGANQVRIAKMTLTISKAASCAHANTTTTTVNATCTAVGSTTVTCDDCGEIMSSEEIAIIDHNYVNGSCTECGQADPNACAHTNTTTTDTATCTQDGEKITVCDACEAEVSRVASSAKGHTPGAEATCTTAQICTVCGDVVTEALGHNYVDNVCSVCGDKIADYAGKYYIATIRTSGNYFYMTNSLGTASTKRYQAVDSGLTTLPESIVGGEAEKIFVIEKNNDGTYSIYAEGITADEKYLGWTSGNSGTLVSKENAVKLTIDKNENGTYTIHFAASDEERYIALNSNSGNNYFAFYRSGQKQDLVLVPVEDGNTECEHNYTTVVTAPTCTEKGYTTYTCSLCNDTYTDNEVAATDHTPGAEATCTTAQTCTVCGATVTAALGHNYVNNVCTVCGDETVDYSGRYYIATIRGEGNYWYMTSDLGTASTKRYTAVDSGLTVLPCVITHPAEGYVFVVEMNDDGTYSIWAEGIESDAKYLGWTSGNSGTLVVASDALKFTLDINQDGTFSFHFTGDEERYLSLNNSAGSDYFAFYKGTQKQNLSLIPIATENASFSGASLNIGQDLSIRYHVIPGAGTVLGDYTVRFTMNEKVVTVSGVEEGGKFVFSFTGIAPQCMGDIVKAELLLNGEVVDTIEEYSVTAYAVSALELHAENGDLCALIVDLLYYGAAAQNYTGYNTENLATSVLTDKEASAFDPAEAAINRGINVIDNTNAKFTAAGVNFDYNNRIYVKFTTEDVANVTVTVGGVELEIVSLGGNKYVAYSDRISALAFDEVVEFTLTYGGETAATLTYTINDYARTMKNDAKIGELAVALYCYGMSAEKYELSK